MHETQQSVATKKKRSEKALLWGVAAATLCAIFWLAATSSSSQACEPKLTEWHWSNEGASEYTTLRYLVGEIKNQSSSTCAYVSVEFRLYDDHHYQVGSALANDSNLEPHGKWRFKAVVTDDEATYA